MNVQKLFTNYFYSALINYCPGFQWFTVTPNLPYEDKVIHSHVKKRHFCSNGIYTLLKYSVTLFVQHRLQKIFESKCLQHILTTVLAIEVD